METFLSLALVLPTAEQDLLVVRNSTKNMSSCHSQISFSHFMQYLDRKRGDKARSDRKIFSA
jgi:hypothetical protein